MRVAESPAARALVCARLLSPCCDVADCWALKKGYCSYTGSQKPSPSDRLLRALNTDVAMRHVVRPGAGRVHRQTDSFRLGHEPTHLPTLFQAGLK